jgi:hypothetical protein
MSNETGKASGTPDASATKLPVCITLKASDTDVLAVMVEDPDAFSLKQLRDEVGEYLKPKDQFLTKDGAPILQSHEKYPIARFVEGNKIGFKRFVDPAAPAPPAQVKIVEIKLKRDADEINTAGRFAVSVKLAEVRREFQARGFMSVDDAFVEPDARQQIPIEDESTRSLASAIKDTTLRITNRANWG